MATNSTNDADRGGEGPRLIPSLSRGSSHSTQETPVFRSDLEAPSISYHPITASIIPLDKHRDDPSQVSKPGISRTGNSHEGTYEADVSGELSLMSGQDGEQHNKRRISLSRYRINDATMFGEMDSNPPSRRNSAFDSRQPSVTNPAHRRNSFAADEYTYTNSTRPPRESFFNNDYARAVLGTTPSSPTSQDPVPDKTNRRNSLDSKEEYLAAVLGATAPNVPEQQNLVERLRQEENELKLRRRQYLEREVEQEELEWERRKQERLDQRHQRRQIVLQKRQLQRQRADDSGYESSHDGDDTVSSTKRVTINAAREDPRVSSIDTEEAATMVAARIGGLPANSRHSSAESVTTSSYMVEDSSSRAETGGDATESVNNHTVTSGTTATTASVQPFPSNASNSQKIEVGSDQPKDPTETTLGTMNHPHRRTGDDRENFDAGREYSGSLWDRAKEDVRDFARMEYTSGDLSSLAQLFFDNLSTILAVLYATQALQQSDSEGEGTPVTIEGGGNAGVSKIIMNGVLFSKVAPGLGLSLFWGNTYYSWMALRLSKQWKRPYTAQPYGINAPIAFYTIFNIIYQIYNDEINAGVAANDAFLTAYKVALASNLVTGLISILLAAFGPLVLKYCPPGSLLIPVAGVAVAFLGLEQLTHSFAAPLVGFNALFWMFLGWYGGVRIKIGRYRMPEALQVMMVGIIMGWATGLNKPDVVQESFKLVEWVGPYWAGGDVLEEFDRVKEYMSIIIPLGITANASTLTCLVSAKEAGDPFPIRETLLVDGIGTVLASLFGSPFGTRVYIGHATHKRTGAQAGYSLLNGVLFLFMSWFGVLALIQSIVNQASVAAIVFIIALTLNEDVLDVMPPRYFAAYIMGILPSICDWVVRVSGRTPDDIREADEKNYNTNLPGTTNWAGVMAFANGALLISIFWSAIVIKTIDRKWTQVCYWCIAAALFSLFGVIHVPEAGFKYLMKDNWENCDPTTLECWEHSEQGRFTVAYLMLAFSAVLVNCAKRWDPSVQDEINDEHSSNAFEDWFDEAATTMVYPDASKRAELRSYLPSIKEIQQYQRDAMEEEEGEEDETGMHNESDLEEEGNGSSRQIQVRRHMERFQREL